MSELSAFQGRLQRLCSEARGPRLCANICDSEKACTGFCFPVTFLFRVVHFQLLPKSHLSLGDHFSRRNKVFISSLESLKVDKSRAANPSVHGIPGFVRNVDSLIPTLLPECLLKYLPEIQQVLASAQCQSLPPKLGLDKTKYHDKRWTFAT